MPKKSDYLRHLRPMRLNWGFSSKSWPIKIAMTLAAIVLVAWALDWI